MKKAVNVPLLLMCGAVAFCIAVTAMHAGLRQRQLEAEKVTAEKNKKAGEAFLADNKTKQGVVTLPSGLEYKILKAGEGKRPTADDTVVCDYLGTLIDGTMFAGSHNRPNLATFSVKGVIKGWTEALPLMPVGSEWQLFVPSQLAYGVRGSSRFIGPNATLIFDMKLLSISSRP